LFDQDDGCPVLGVDLTQIFDDLLSRFGEFPLEYIITLDIVRKTSIIRNMSSNDINPSPDQVLTHEEQVRAYVNPTRMTILAFLAREKDSVSGVARRLNVHPANLTHHFKLLEKVGLIQLVEKRETGKNLEKLYRAVAYHFTVNAGVRISNKQVLGLSILRDNLTAAIQSLSSQPEDHIVLGVLKTVRLSPEDILKFQQRLLDLAEEFGVSAATDGVVYSLNGSLYPTEAGPLPAQEISIRAEK
jgi:DNA-binding transcriptional ArsR family regulator